MTRMPFGRYRGVLLQDLPDSYLAWLRSLPDLRTPLRMLVETEWRRRFEPRSRPERRKVGMSSDEAEMAKEIISAGYRSLTKKFHPAGIVS